MAGGALSKPQDLWLKLIRLSSFNLFDGDRVVDDLLKHRDLWLSAIMIQDPAGITLRDLPEGAHNVGTLLIMTEIDRAAALYDLAAKWQADEINWIEDIRFLGGVRERKVLSLWWD